MGHNCLKADIMLFAYALATTASGLLARAQVVQGHSAGPSRTGRLGTGIEGLRFLDPTGPRKSAPQPGHRMVRW